MSDIVTVQDVSYSYGTDEVLQRISFGVPEGDYLGLIGPNGAGKTTLLKIILGLLPITSGSVRFFEKDIRDFQEWSKIGYVPQKVTNFDTNFPATVAEVVLMGRFAPRGLFHGTNADDRRMAQQALEQVGMWEFHDRLIGDLSGGQQQRVFIARALAVQPEIIFLDEPTTGVDQQTHDEFYSLLRHLNHDLGITLILISHDIDMVVREAKHIAYVDKTLLCHDVPEEFLKHSSLSNAFKGDTKMIRHAGHGSN